MCLVVKPLDQFYPYKDQRQPGKIYHRTHCIDCDRPKAKDRMRRLHEYGGTSNEIHTKICKACNLDKPLSEFHLVTSTAGGKKHHGTYCDPCDRVHARERMRLLHGYYDRHPEESLGTSKSRQATPVDPQLAAFRDTHKDKLAALKNVHTGVVQGYVYVVTNPAWPGWVKIGCAVDPVDRADSYQTGSPHRDYKLEGYAFTERRRDAERNIHKALGDAIGAREWFFIDVQQALDTVKKFCLQQSTSGKD